ncbi:hypothetical protein KKC13_05310 [bacterium]|nr:hypothetical protein [bacterium]MBU1958138.1 hypothetical protein [bacterium]
MLEYHDPYLNTVKRTLDDKQSKERKKKFKQQSAHHNQQSFLEQNIDLNNYLPESLRNIIGTALFIMLPYIIGITFLFFIIAQANIDTYHKIEANSFFLAWSIGYELIAFFILLIIIKSAINFHKIRKLME